MRLIEVPAAGGCFLVERTQEHQEIFGPDGEAVTYFDDIDGMVRETRRLLDDEPRRERLRARALDVITRGQFTYVDRLRTLIGHTGSGLTEGSRHRPPASAEGSGEAGRNPKRGSHVSGLHARAW
jgi:spore maturation protein CgeB